MHTRAEGIIVLWLVSTIGLLCDVSAAGGPFRLVSMQEASIADIHAAMQAKELTCRQAD